MSTLTEIASAADRLPVSEQHQLLEQLSRKLRAPKPAAQRESPKEWMARLEKGAQAISTGRHSITVDQIIDELREERI